MKQITLTIGQMKHLEELGVDISKAGMVYYKYKETTEEWLDEGHFVINEKSKDFIKLAIRDKDERLYHDLDDHSGYVCYEIIPTFTLQDILELLPNFILKDGLYYDLMSDMHNSMVYKRDWDSIEDDELLDEDDLYLHTESDGSNLLNMAYRMLCWVAKNGYLNKKEE